MIAIERFLDEFKAAMLAKFRERHERQHARGNKSVLDPDFDWSVDLDILHITDHFREEYSEWLRAEGPRERSKEDIDVANMAFLDWVYWRIVIEREGNP